MMDLIISFGMKLIIICGMALVLLTFCWLVWSGICLWMAWVIVMKNDTDGNGD